MLRGEIGIKIKDITIRQFLTSKDTYEMTIYDEDGGFLHIVGDNNLPELFQKAIDNKIIFTLK